MENQAIIVKGRLIETQFENVGAIRDTAAFVDKWAKKSGLKQLSFVYCGTTINWPDDLGYACIVGWVLLDDIYEDDDALPQKFSRDRLTLNKEIPEKFWTDLKEFGISVGETEATYLTVGGWGWADLKDDDALLVRVSGEDYAFKKLDIDSLQSGSGQLSLTVGYC